jgi:hypothetical protein
MAECSLVGLLGAGGPVRVTVRPCCLAALRVEEVLPGVRDGETASFECAAAAAESPAAESVAAVP